MANRNSPAGHDRTETRHDFRAGRIVYGLGFAAALWERLWPLLVPVFLVLCAYAAIAWAGVWQWLNEPLRYGGLALFALIFLASLYPLRQFRWPERLAVLRRLERETGLSHRPVTAQIDRPANLKDDFSAALWKAHRQRMARGLNDLSAGVAKPRANRFDRWALRAMLPIIAFVAWGVSLGPQGGRLADAFRPHVDPAAVLSRLDIWIAPPAYTGRPPVYLSRQQDLGGGEPLNVLTGSALNMRYVGNEPVHAQLRETAATSTLEPAGEDGAGEIAFRETLTHSAIIEFFARDRLVASWPYRIVADRAPAIRFEAPPSGALSGALELTYAVEDDYGVVAARGLIRSLETGDPDARPLVEAPELQLPLPRSRAKSGTAKVNRDLSSHPWAGGRVEIVLEASDDPGQIGRSRPIEMILPGRNFTDPMAKALVEQRRILANDANKSRYVADLLDAVTTHPAVFDIDPTAYLTLTMAYRMIAQADDDDRLREALDILWETALALELGDLSDVERRLREAQEKLSKALEEGASEEEIEKLMDELRQAMNDFLEQLARQMAENPIQQSPLSNLQNLEMLTQRDIERMMDRIEDLAKSGSRDAARELLSEMQRMMDNLRAGQHQQQRRAEGNELNEALDKLSEMMRRQQELMDETFSMRNRAPAPNGRDGENREPGQRSGENQPGENGENQPGGNQPMTAEEFAEALRRLQEQQQGLRGELGELGDQLGELGLDPGEAFGEAGREMGEAGDNLGEGQPGAAAGDQGEALDALRRGAQSMMQQMAGDRNQGGTQPGQAGVDGRDRQRSDPLGRRTGARGRINDENTKVPSEIDAQRAREIMDAIRKRLSDPLRPLLERNYLERLLEGR